MIGFVAGFPDHVQYSGVIQVRMFFDKPGDAGFVELVPVGFIERSQLVDKGVERPEPSSTLGLFGLFALFS